jgi:2-methylcitrate dehydratase
VRSVFVIINISNSTDAAAADPRIDALRAKMHCVEEKTFSVDYHDPEKRSIGNSLLVELNDGTVLDEVQVEYPVGHKRRASALLRQVFVSDFCHSAQKEHLC